jgi:hypothetical protein
MIVLKVLLPLLFVVLADGQIAGSPLEPPPLATDRAHEGEAKTEKAPDKHADKAPEKASEKVEPKAEKAPEAKPDAHAPEKAPPAAEAAKHETPAAKPAGAKPAAVAKTTGAHGGKKSGKDAGGARGEPERTPTPAPGISAGAMNDEMFNRGREAKAASERERLEALSNDLSRARSELRDETTRLEAMVEKAKQAGIKPSEGKGGATAPAAAAAKDGPRGDGGPMPLGDPLAPNAYYRPAPPPPNFAVQVEVVSKAIKSMKPEQAAGVIGHLERGLAAEILQRMRPADAGAILGFLKPEVGAALAAEIVSRPPVSRAAKDADKEKP